MVHSTVVTRANFRALLPSVLHNLREADFVALDTELTGLCADASKSYNLYDDPQTRYAKLRESAETFGVLQYGLSAFKWSHTARRYEATTWAFHVFPASTGTSADDYTCWKIQLPTVHFLNEHGFDFNKSLKEGVPFLSHADEAEARRKRAERMERDRATCFSNLSPEDTLFIEEMARMIDAHMAAHGANDPMNVAVDIPTLDLPVMTSRNRALMYKRMHQYCPCVIVAKAGDIPQGEDGPMRAIFQTTLQADAKFEDDLTELIGFRRVIDQLSRFEKPVVGHNCWLDMMHAGNGLVGPLPRQLEVFARETLSGRLLPGRACIFDTKNVARAVFRELDGFVPQEAALALSSQWDTPVVVDIDTLTVSEASDKAVQWTRRGAGDRLMYASAAYGGATESELTKAARKTSLENLARIVDDTSTWGVRVPVSGGKATTAGRRSQKAEPAASFHDAGFDAFCTGKVFVAFAALVACRLFGDDGKSPEAARDIVDALTSGAETARGVDIPPAVSATRDQVFMMASDYEDVDIIRGDSSVLARQRHPDRGNLLVVSAADGRAVLRTEGVIAAVRLAIGRRTYVRRDSSGAETRVEWPHVSPAGGFTPYDGTITYGHAQAYVLLPFAVPCLEGVDEDGAASVSVAVGGQSVEVFVWPYAKWLEHSLGDGRDSPKRPRPCP